MFMEAMKGRPAKLDGRVIGLGLGPMYRGQ